MDWKEKLQPLSERNNRKEDWRPDTVVTADEEEDASCCSASTLKASNVLVREDSLASYLASTKFRYMLCFV